MAKILTTPLGKTTQTAKLTPTVPPFDTWIQDRPGLTKTELLDIYATTFDITPQQRATILNQITTQEKAAGQAALDQARKTAEEKLKSVQAELIIARTGYPKWWKDSGVSGVTIVGPGSQQVVGYTPNQTLFIASITLLVDGPTIISFGFGTAGATGPMALGDTDQPKGITINMSDAPAPCGSGGFNIVSNADPSTTLGGFVVYFKVRDTVTTPTKNPGE